MLKNIAEGVLELVQTVLFKCMLGESIVILVSNINISIWR